MIDKVIWELPQAKQAFAIACLYACVSAACIIICAVSLGSALYNLWCTQPLQDQFPLFALFALGFLAQSLLRSAEDRYFFKFAQKSCSVLRQQLLGKIFSEGYQLVAEKRSATLTTLALTDLDVINTYARNMPSRIANMALITSLVVIALWCLDWVSGLIALLTIPTIILFMALLGSMSQKAATSQRGVYEQLSNSFSDALQGIATLKQLGISKSWESTITSSSERFRIATMKVLRVATLSGSTLDMISTLALAAIAVMLGFRLVDGSIGLQTALIILILVPDCYKPIRAFASDFHSSLDGKNALIALLDIIKSEHATPQSNTVPQANLSSHTKAPSASTQSPSAPLSVTFEDVSFSYGSDAPLVLSHINQTFTSPNIIGIVGPSGVGKSTLTALIAGFLQPTSGTLYISKNGVRLSREQWRNEVIYLPQKPFIFHGTLRENVAFYTPTASDEAILAALDKVGLGQLLATLELGLDTIIGEAGRQLSGGEAHRVALCRALLDSSRQILIFDEPTAHLDIETEIALKEPMEELMRGKLVFFGTHRLHWLNSFDEVVQIANTSLIRSSDFLTQEGECTL